ncbi:MAG: class I SAM-dependent methyltransferase [Planctomycetes bacterium]|nr:class I SAM-dependent methyltransferase [Planctomycetota bacterium]
MSETPYVFEGSRHDAELERLRALEGVFDSATRKRLLATGLGLGWRCLEVGAGAGSIAKWMGDTVGETGHVLAVDMNPRFLSAIESANLGVQEADIRTARIEPESFDLAHARFVLIHVPDGTEALAAMIRCLKPGGWLVLEEPDFSCSRALAGRPELCCAFRNVHQAIEAMFRQRGMDYAFGARLPALLQDRAFEAMLIENDAAIVPGDSPHAKMMGLSTYQLRDKYVATGLATEEDIERYGTFAADPTCWATYHATISAVGRKPMKGGRV